MHPMDPTCGRSPSSLVTTCTIRPLVTLADKYNLAVSNSRPAGPAACLPACLPACDSAPSAHSAQVPVQAALFTCLMHQHLCTCYCTGHVALLLALDKHSQCASVALQFSCRCFTQQ
jgi:hypothetical protein